MTSQPTIESLLIPSKTRVPDVRAGTIRRHALVERLLASGQRRIISVTAPGGYGKSLLLAQWAAEDTRPLAWLSLDPDDSDTTLFLQYVAAGSRAGRSAWRQISFPAPSGWQMPGRSFRRFGPRWPRAEPFVLVIDDTQWLEGDALDALLMLARDIPHGSQLALCGRSDLGRLLSRGRLGGETLELTARDLALDDTEARELFESSAIDLSDSVVHEINSHVEGWAAGLYLSRVGDARNGITSGFRRDAPRPLRLRLLRRRSRRAPGGSARFPERVVGAHPDVPGAL